MKKFKIILFLFAMCLSLCGVNAADTNSMSLESQAIMASKQGNNVKALSLINNAIKNDSNNANLYNRRGIIKEALKDYDGAMADYDYALKLNPIFAEAYYNKGLLYEGKGNIVLATENFFKSADIYPCYDVYASIGNLFQEKQGYVIAIDFYTLAISYIQSDINESKKNKTLDKSKYEVAYYGRGMSNFLLKNYSVAIPDFDKAIQYKAYNPDAYLARGLSKFGVGNKNQALSDLSIAKLQYEKLGNKSGYGRAIEAMEMVRKL